MKKVFALILVPVMLLILTACSKSVKSNPPQNDLSEHGSTPQIEITPDMLSVPDNNSSEIEPDKNEAVESIAVSNKSIVPQPDPSPQPKPESMTNAEEKGNDLPNISITVGSSIFPVKLYDNRAARAFLAQFPLTLNMSDLNSNEKYYYLSDDLPSESTERPTTMNAGDLMCWSGNCLVLFYKGFSNSYGGYVRLGYVEDASGLAATLGNGSVEITFAVTE